MQREISTMEELSVFAREVAATLHGGEVLGLVGDLGAGKTTFTQVLARALGVTVAVKSPTFTLMQEYETGESAARQGVRSMVHVDAYRVDDPRELEVIGLFDVAGAAGTVTVVEWAEKVPKLRNIKGYRELIFLMEGEKRIIEMA